MGDDLFSTVVVSIDVNTSGSCCPVALTPSQRAALQPSIIYQTDTLTLISNESEMEKQQNTENWDYENWDYENWDYENWE